MFLALDLSTEARAALAAWRDEALVGLDELRPVPPEALHLTLVFLGYRPEREIAAIAAAVFEGVGDLPGARLEPVEVRSVPSRRPRLFALDLEDQDGRAAAIQAAAAGLLADAGFYEPEKRPFWPHITLARVQKGRRAQPIAPDPAAGRALRPLVARELTLYRSTLRPQGASYEPLERLSLGAAPPSTSGGAATRA